MPTFYVSCIIPSRAPKIFYSVAVSNQYQKQQKETTLSLTNLIVPATSFIYNQSTTHIILIIKLALVSAILCVLFSECTLGDPTQRAALILFNRVHT